MHLLRAEIIRLGDNDNITIARAKLSAIDARRIIFVIPSRLSHINQRLHLILLLRECRHRGIVFSLVTKDKDVIFEAHNLGIPAFPSISLAQKKSWRRGHIYRSESHLNLFAQMDSAARKNLFTNPFSFRKIHSNFYERQIKLNSNIINLEQLHDNSRLKSIVFLISIICFFICVGVFIPGANIVIDMKKISQDLPLTLSASPDVISPGLSGELPAKSISIVLDGSKEINSTGTLNLPDKNATGEVLLINLTEEPIRVSTGMVVLTLSQPPVRFTIQQSIDVPPGDDNGVRVSIRALDAGKNGNVEADQIKAFEGETGLYLIVTNPEATYGGEDRKIPAPSETDFQKLKMQILKELNEIAASELQLSLAEGNRLIPATVKMDSIVEEHVEPAIGSPADKLFLALKVKYDAWYIKEEDEKSVAQLVLNANLPAHVVPVQDSMKIVPMSEPQVKGNSVTWLVMASQLIRQEWLSSQLFELTGKKVNEAELLLSSNYDLEQQPEIKIFPPLWRRMPFLIFRFTIEVK